MSSGWGTAPFDRAKGSFDPVARTGSVTGRSKALFFESSTQKTRHTGHAWGIDNIGLVVKNGRVFITGQIHSARTQLTAARRQTIAVIARPKFDYGVGHSFSPRGKDLGIQPNSFVMSARGRATITKAFAAAAARWRCKGRFASQRRPHVRTGESLGAVTVSLGALAATGVSGDVALVRFEFFDGVEGDPIALTATAPAVKKRTAESNGLRFPVAGPANTPLKCNLGASCSPIGGGASLQGGFTLSFSGRSTTIADLAVAWQLDADGFLRHTLTGTVDGQPMTIATGSDPAPTEEFLARISDSLGTRVSERVGGLDPQFTGTAPAG
jgi:hypothetical protein